MKALDMAVEYSMREGSRLTLMYVAIPPVFCGSQSVLEEVRRMAMDEIRRYGESVLEASESRCKAYGLTVRRILRVAEADSGSPANEILKEAVNGHYDCVILGSRDCGAKRSLLLGSVGISVAINAPCTTIIVR